MNFFLALKNCQLLRWWWGLGIVMSSQLWYQWSVQYTVVIATLKFLENAVVFLFKVSHVFTGFDKFVWKSFCYKSMTDHVCSLFSHMYCRRKCDGRARTNEWEGPKRGCHCHRNIWVAIGNDSVLIFSRIVDSSYVLSCGHDFKLAV